MAIIKSYDTAFGLLVPEAYWVISHLSFSRLDQIAEAMVSIFLNEGSRRSGLAPVGTMSVRVPDSEYDSVVSDGIPALYECLKDQELSGGTDA